MSSKVNINLIWAQARDRVIGNHGTMPWHIPEDLSHFREVTNNHPVIMGRKTWESLPPKFRPLPNRRNIVLTRQPNWGEQFNEDADSTKTSVIKANSITAAIKPQITGPGVKEVWVVGGGEIYKQFLNIASRIEITEIHESFEGDTLAPEIFLEEWKEVRRIPNKSTSGVKFDFVSYQRIQGNEGQHSLIF